MIQQVTLWLTRLIHGLGLFQSSSFGILCSSKDVHHILPTSNVVERLFSRAKLIKTDHRKTMTAAHLDAVLFLRYNRGRWNEQTIQGLLDEKQAAVIELEEEEEEDV
jgi:hypothetical protein